MKRMLDSLTAGAATLLISCAGANNEPPKIDPAQERYAEEGNDSTTEQVQECVPQIATQEVPEADVRPFTGKLEPFNPDPLKGVTSNAVRIYARLCTAMISSEKAFSKGLNESPIQSCYEISMRREFIRTVLERCMRLTLPGVENIVVEPETKLQIRSVRTLLVPLVEEMKELDDNPCLRSRRKERERI
ncbi:hypothetical protein ACFL2V_15755 [Pseudomonadota bacterium]